MGSGPLAQPLFYQYKCTCGRMDRLCRNGSGEISAIHERLAPIIIKCGNLIRLDLFDSRPRSRARCSIAFQHPNPSPQDWSNCGTAAAGMPFCLPPPASRAAEGGGGCLTSATAQPWQVQDGRRRPDWRAATGMGTIQFQPAFQAGRRAITKPAYRSA